MTAGPSARYVGRFAPSPTGPLHAGSLVAALASYLDARAHGGKWLVRIEDLDPPREQPGAIEHILDTLRDLGLHGDGPVLHQSERHAAYEAALQSLIAAGKAYPCSCSRKEIADSRLGLGLPLGQAYPGTCRAGLAPGRAARSWRLRVPAGIIRVADRCLGEIVQDLEAETGDFVLKRADGCWAYQLAVVVDDAFQGITDVVRGADLAESTPRQTVLQQALGWPTPRYLHVPVVLAEDGQKLSKQTGAQALDRSRPLAMLMRAWTDLGFAPIEAPDVPGFLARATGHWARRFGPAPD
jgi:glutamyl-Q tRNA(Asp) synthetase